MPTKFCTKGKHNVALGGFPKNPKMISGLDSWCLECRRKVGGERRARPGYKEHAQKLRMIKIDANPRAYKNKVLLQKFGITIGDYDKMLADQDDVCAICECPETAKDVRRGKVKDLAVDHCHKTGKIRGLLCDRCNTSIGKFEENVIYLKSAVSYLTR